MCLVYITALSCTKKAEYPAAHALVTRYVLLMKEIGMQGQLDMPGLDQDLKKFQADLDGMKAGVPEAFHTRFERLIRVSRLSFGWYLAEPEKVAEAKREVGAFIKDVQGRDIEDDLGEGLAEVSSAFRDEVLNLHMLLDGTKDKKEAWKKYLEKHVGPYLP
jgi:hypothetical protein